MSLSMQMKTVLAELCTCMDLNARSLCVSRDMDDFDRLHCGTCFGGVGPRINLIAIPSIVQTHSFPQLFRYVLRHLSVSTLKASDDPALELCESCTPILFQLGPIPTGLSPSQSTAPSHPAWYQVYAWCLHSSLQCCGERQFALGPCSARARKVLHIDC